MYHKEYIRKVENSPFAVLMLHGIAGTPAHFRDLLPVIPEDWSVYALLLDGHGKEVADFGASSMKKWKAQAAAAVENILKEHKNLLIIGHSMGTLFAIQAAIDHPKRIPELFLLAAPLRPWVRFSTVFTSLRVMWGNIRPNDRAGLAMANATGIRMTRKFWKYASWIPRLWELLVEIRRIRGILPQLQTPTQSFQSRVDELVSMRSCSQLRRNPCIRITVLEGSGHFAYGPEDTALLQKRLRETVERLTCGRREIR